MSELILNPEERSHNEAPFEPIESIIEAALREPGRFVERWSLDAPTVLKLEPAVAWQARAVAAALKEKGVFA